MAHAQRNVYLEPEEPDESLVRQPRLPRRGERAPALLRRPLVATVTVATVVALVVAYIGIYACIARCEMRRQAGLQEVARIDRECVKLRLDLDRLAAQPHLLRVAETYGLDLPDASRIEQVRVADDGKWTSAVASAAPEPQHRSWFSRSRRHVVAALGSALQRLAHGPGATAYAQE